MYIFGHSSKKVLAQTQIVARNDYARGVIVPVVLLHARAHGFESGQSGWVAEMLESMMLFVVVSVLEKVCFVVFRVRWCLHNRR